MLAYILLHLISFTHLTNRYTAVAVAGTFRSPSNTQTLDSTFASGSTLNASAERDNMIPAFRARHLTSLLATSTSRSDVSPSLAKARADALDRALKSASK